MSGLIRDSWRMPCVTGPASVTQARQGATAIDWTIEADQHLLVVSLVVGRRAVPIYWRAYHASVLKGRMKRYELASSAVQWDGWPRPWAHAASS